MARINIIEPRGYRGQFIECQRVIYGKKDTQRKDCEYKSNSSPVGTIEDWAETARKIGLQGVILEDTINNETIVIVLKKSDYVIKVLDHTTKTVTSGRNVFYG